ncbi:MAG: hypothetical protein K2Q10_12040, partial [Rhodospirillales bacterium]|nr:hypothetical protein [Rhodospirillales bacterium]
MPPLVVGLLILLALVLAGRWFATTPPASVIRSVKWSIAVLLAGVMVLLILSGRLAYALAALAAMTPWVARGLYLHSLYRGLHNAWNRMRG